MAHHTHLGPLKRIKYWREAPILLFSFLAVLASNSKVKRIADHFEGLHISQIEEVFFNFSLVVVPSICCYFYRPKI
jgi:hypothetical protein